MLLRALTIVLILSCCLPLMFSTSAQSANQQQTEPEEVIKVGSELVNIPVVVKRKRDYGPPVLQAEHFELFEDGVKQQISLFAIEDAPVSVTLLIDASNIDDINKINITFAQSAANELIEAIGDNVAVKIVSFSDKISILSEFTNDKDQLRKAVSELKPGGQDRFGDVLVDTAREMKKLKGRKILLLLTDIIGESKYTENEILNELAESGAIAYVLGYPLLYKKPFPCGQMPNIQQRYPLKPIPNNNEKFAFVSYKEKKAKDYFVGFDFLIKIAESTGGLNYTYSIDTIPGFMKKILEGIESTYSFGYYPTNPVQNGGFRKIKLVLNDKFKASLRYKKGYNAGEQNDQLQSGN